MANYWVVDCISGCRDEVEPIKGIQEARRIRDEWNRKNKEEGGTGEFWIIVNSNGETVE